MIGEQQSMKNWLQRHALSLGMPTHQSEATAQILQSITMSV